MRNEIYGDIKVGDILFRVDRFEDDKKLHISKTRVVDVVRTKTPTGRDRKPIIKAVGANYVRTTTPDKGQIFEIDPQYFYKTATDAVSRSLEMYLTNVDRNFCGSSPNERLLRDLCHALPDGRICTSKLAYAIFDLVNYHALFREAFEIDDETVQAIDIPIEQDG